MRDTNKLYKKLDHIQHILLRPERYLGSTRETTEDTWLINQDTNSIFNSNVTYRPVLLKLFDEIIINSVDFSKTPEGSHLDTINVNVSWFTGNISVEDNGGIPVVHHKDYPDGWLPDMLFGELFSSSNYNENDEEYANADGGGQNGEGASLVNVFSKTFKVVTCDGKNRYERVWRNNMDKDSTPATIRPGKKKGTTISFIPDFSRFHNNPTRMSRMDEAMIIRRVYEVAACNPQLNINLNGKPVKINSFKDFAGFFNCTSIEETEDWSVGIFKADQFTHHSYVNSIHTTVGGSHIDYVADKIISYVRPKLKRAYKVDYKPGVIKGILGLVIISKIQFPRFSTQTKTDLTTKVSEFGTSWEPSKKFLDKCAISIVDWMKDYHQSVIEKEEDKALDEAEKEAKATPYYHIPKYERATSQDRSKCVLFLTEGDSAAKPILAARNTKIHGVFPLRGKLLNVISASKKEIGSSAEIQSIMAIMQGLSIRNGVDFKKLRYQEVVVSTDADVDGLHIRGLVCAAFMNLWPEFIMEGRLKYLVTPVVVAKKGKQRFEYFKEKDFEEALHNGMKFDRVKYLKGLGSNDAEAFSEYLNNPKYKMSFTYDDLADISMDLAFNKKRAEDRKPLFDTLSMVDVEEL